MDAEHGQPGGLDQRAQLASWCLLAPRRGRPADGRARPRAKRLRVRVAPTVAAEAGVQEIKSGG